MRYVNFWKWKLLNYIFIAFGLYSFFKTLIGNPGISKLLFEPYRKKRVTNTTADDNGDEEEENDDLEVHSTEFDLCKHCEIHKGSKY